MAARPHVTVREATADDVEAFASFFREAWTMSGPGASGFTGATDEIIAELTRRDEILARIGGPDRRLYLAWSADRVVGFAATRRLDQDVVELAGIIVLPSAAGQGIGTLLVEAVIEAAAAAGYRAMVVRTETTNDVARSFYERNGFMVSSTAIEDVEGTEVPVVELHRGL